MPQNRLKYFKYQYTGIYVARILAVMNAKQSVFVILVFFLLFTARKYGSVFSAVYDVFMAALWNRAGHYIFMLWFLSSIFFPRLISAVGDWMSTILLHTVWS